MDISQVQDAAPMNGTEYVLGFQSDVLVRFNGFSVPVSNVKKYAATLTQTGTSDPIVKRAVDNIGIVWARIDANNYNGIKTGAFPADRTIINLGVDINGNYLSRVDDDTLNFFCAGGDGTITDYPISIEVYPKLLTDSPANFTATAFDYQQIDLAWDAVTGANNYILERSDDSVSWIEAYNGTGTSYSDGVLASDTQYFYRLIAQTTGLLDSAFVYADATTLSPP